MKHVFGVILCVILSVAYRADSMQQTCSAQNVAEQQKRVTLTYLGPNALTFGGPVLSYVMPISTLRSDESMHLCIDTADMAWDLLTSTSHSQAQTKWKEFLEKFVQKIETPTIQTRGYKEFVPEVQDQTHISTFLRQWKGYIETWDGEGKDSEVYMWLGTTIEIIENFVNGPQSSERTQDRTNPLHIQREHGAHGGSLAADQGGGGGGGGGGSDEEDSGSPADGGGGDDDDYEKWLLNLDSGDRIMIYAALKHVEINIKIPAELEKDVWYMTSGILGQYKKKYALHWHDHTSEFHADVKEKVGSIIAEWNARKKSGNVFGNALKAAGKAAGSARNAVRASLRRSGASSFRGAADDG